MRFDPGCRVRLWNWKERGTISLCSYLPHNLPGGDLLDGKTTLNVNLINLPPTVISAILEDEIPQVKYLFSSVCVL